MTRPASSSPSRCSPACRPCRSRRRTRVPRSTSVSTRSPSGKPSTSSRRSSALSPARSTRSRRSTRPCVPGAFPCRCRGRAPSPIPTGPAPGLELSQRELLILCSLATIGDTAAQLEPHARACFQVGNSKAEVVAALVHCFRYIGLPRAVTAIRVVQRQQAPVASPIGAWPAPSLRWAKGWPSVLPLRQSGHGESPRSMAASNSVLATCSAFSVAAAPTGFAS